MKIRRILATAVAAAVTTPAVLLSVTPAFADTKPSAPQSQTTKAAKKSIAELEKAAAEAQKAYDAALAAEKTAKAVWDAAMADDAPHALAAKAAEQEAKAAAAAKTAADQAVTDAKAELAALPAEATEEERAAAQKAVEDAEAVAVTAAADKTAADEKAKAVASAADDVRVAAGQAYTKAQKATAEALKAKKAADEALADAKKDEGDEGDDGDGDEEDACVLESKLTTVVTGLPSKVVAGTTVNFSLRVSNGSKKTMDEVYTHAAVHAFDKRGYKSFDDLLKLQWSSASSTKWKPLDDDRYIDVISPLKAGAHTDIKLRLTVDAKAPAGEGVAVAAGSYFNEDGSCGGTPDSDLYDFEIAPVGTKPGKVDDAQPSGNRPHAPGTTPQGVTSVQPVNATSGTLAATGSSSAVPQIALAGGVAVAMGAGAMLVVRRRKAGADG
ncbi:peptidase [Streptomyces sp. NPDC006368]|uniref:peptidase n=1 Tax=Streptomyces sp. NPDC006368 TaxID=3156760 RepID=UPI0033BEBA14